jgi:hypothetical protein
MIKGEFVIIKQITHNFEYYLKLGYNVIKGEKLEVKIKDLPITSHKEIDIVCDICGFERTMEYRKYLERISTYDFYACSGCRFTKTKITNNLKYKVDNVFQLEKTKEKSSTTKLKKYKNVKYRNDDKIKNTNITKYGYENVFQIPENILIIQEKSKNTRIKKGKQIPDEQLTEWEIYKKEVTHMTAKHTNNLYQNWNGFDYYDNEYIKENMNLNWFDSKHPSIDHKISTFYGFNNKISPELIGNINNLCITKRGINTSKSTKNESEYKLKFNI